MNLWTKTLPYLKAQKKYILYILLLLPFDAISGYLAPLILKSAIDDGIANSHLEWIYITLAAYAMLIFLGFGIKALQGFMSDLFVESFVRKIRLDLSLHILKLPAHFHDKNLSGTLVSRATSDCDNLAESLGQGVLRAMIDMVALFGSIAGMFYLHPTLALIATLTLPLVFFIIDRLSKIMKSSMMDARIFTASSNGFLNESLIGIATVKILSGANDARKKFAKFNAGFRHAQMKSVLADAVLFAILDGVATMTVGFILYIIASRYFEVDLSFGFVVAFVRYTEQMFDPMKQIANTMAMLAAVRTALERIFGILDEKPNEEGQSTTFDPNAPITLTHVSFRYPGNSKEVLRDISLTLSPGKSLALVGLTGSGKSTIFRLLCKMYPDYHGNITIGGHSLSDYHSEFLRSNIGIVPQDPFLFAASIAENIHLGRNISNTDVKRAAEIVGLHEIVTDFPGGYDYKLSEGGSNLSHGQRQLIVFARALCTNPRILFLDEATSTIDPMTEELITKAFKSMLKGRTVLSIAHRLSTVKEADQICYLKDGMIVESGTHELLMTLRGHYYTMVKRGGI